MVIMIEEDGLNWLCLAYVCGRTNRDSLSIVLVCICIGHVCLLYVVYWATETTCQLEQYQYK